MEADSLHRQCMWFNTIIPFQPSIRWRWNVFMDVFILCNIYGCHCLGQGSLEKDISVWMGFSTQWNKNILSVLCCTAEKFSWIICCHLPLLMSFVVRVKALRKADILYILYCPPYRWMALANLYNGVFHVLLFILPKWWMQRQKQNTNTLRH